MTTSTRGRSSPRAARSVQSKTDAVSTDDDVDGPGEVASGYTEGVDDEPVETAEMNV